MTLGGETFAVSSGITVVFSGTTQTSAVTIATGTSVSTLINPTKGSGSGDGPFGGSPTPSAYVFGAVKAAQGGLAALAIIAGVAML